MDTEVRNRCWKHTRTICPLSIFTAKLKRRASENRQTISEVRASENSIETEAAAAVTQTMDYRCTRAFCEKVPARTRAAGRESSPGEGGRVEGGVIRYSWLNSCGVEG